MREQLVSLIRSFVSQHNAFELLEQALFNLDEKALIQALSTCGVIPEHFANSSSEEKLWAKACDILLAMAWNHLGITAQVLRVRGDSADVLGKTIHYTIVGDAKAFRLSRTAKNQKDFKITALDEWRRSDTYACLLAPYYQYPVKNSQIYTQAKSRNVTLLSYAHLHFLIVYCQKDKDLTPLWTTSGKLQPSHDARSYWSAINDTIIELTNQSHQTLKLYLQQEAHYLTQIAQEGIEYWQSVMERYQSLTRQEAIERLIKTERLDENIAQIKLTLVRAKNLYD